jgi:tetratricopeptide (TPR) repeat protein
MTDNQTIGAIMVTYFKGYSALLQQNDPSAVKKRDKYRKIITQASDKFNGKILHYYGERTLSIFYDINEAVKCALDLQLEYRQEPVLPVSIGIHQGSIFIDKEEIAGDDVYLTSWLASEAVSGSVLVSDSIYDKIKNQPEVNTKFLRTCQIKKIEKSFGVYAISNTGLVVPDRFQLKGEFRFSDHRSTGALINFWAELKRRKVIRVVTVYAAISYATLELTSIVEEPLGFPEWTLKFLIILLSVGFVLIAIISWVYDFTPDGIKVTEPLRSNNQFYWSNDQSDSVGFMVSKSNNKSQNTAKRFLLKSLLPILAFILIVVFIKYWDNIFNRTKMKREVAKIHVENAKSIIQQQGDLSTARKELELAITFDSLNASAYNTYALINLAEKDTAAAKEKLFSAIKIDSTLAIAWSNLAAISFHENNMELALYYTINAVEYDPMNKLAAYNMAFQSEHRGLSDQAVEWYKKAISMDSSFTDAYSALGALYNKMDRPVDAILVLQKSLRLSPRSDQNYRLYKNLAESHFYLQEYDKAFYYLEQSKYLMPDYPETEKCFARLYEAKGDIEQSILHWREYIELETDELKALEAEHHLRTLQ